MAKKSVPPGRTDPTYSKHVRLYDWMMRSHAWQQLSHAARSLYIELERRHNGANNGDLHMSVREAADLLRCSKNHAHTCFKELEAKGFIRPGQRGAFSLKQRHATTWILTTYGLPHDPRPTKEFMSWRPVDGAEMKQNPVPSRGTDGLTTRDRETPTVSPRGTDGLTTRDREALRTVGDGRTTRDTTSLPQGAQPEGDDAPVSGEEESSTPTSAAGRQPDPTALHQDNPSRPSSSPAPNRRAAAPVDPTQIDLEDLTGRANQPHPDAVLREAAKAWCHQEGRGANKRLAAMIGLSSYQLSNFKSGTFGLNDTAKAMLRSIVIEGRKAA